MAKVWGLVFSFILLLVFSALITGIFVWLAWNAVMPYLFQLPQIDIIQGWALAILGGVLFKSTSYSSK